MYKNIALAFIICFSVGKATAQRRSRIDTFDYKKVKFVDGQIILWKSEKNYLISTEPIFRFLGANTSHLKTLVFKGYGKSTDFDSIALEKNNYLDTMCKPLGVEIVHAKSLTIFWPWYRHLNQKAILDLYIEDSLTNPVSIIGEFQKIQIGRNSTRTFDSDSLVIKQVISDSATFDNGTFGSVSIENSQIKNLDLRLITIYKSLKIDSGSFESINLGKADMPKSIQLSNIDFTTLKGQIDLRNLGYNGVRTLILANIDLTKLTIPLDKFNFIISDNETYEQESLLYQQLLKLLKDAGLTEKYEQQDKLFQELKLLHNNHPILNWIAKYWWDYGYDKGRIFYISFFFFIFFFILNTLFIVQLQQVFFPETFVSSRALILHRTRNPTPFIARVYQLPGLFLYTAYIFWGLKLDLKQIKLTNWLAVILILIQYIIGIICLAYLANYVISK